MKLQELGRPRVHGGGEISKDCTIRRIRNQEPRMDSERPDTKRLSQIKGAQMI